MSAPTLFEIEAPSEPGAVPCCSVCGARGPVIVPDGSAVRDFYAATQFALIAIAEHVREMHPEVRS